jgi:hypothetical protein
MLHARFHQEVYFMTGRAFSGTAYKVVAIMQATIVNVRS